MVKRIIPGNMSPWECEINDVKYVYPPGTEQMVPDEVAHVIDAWYASQEPKYPEPVQPEGGGAQPDWNAAEGEPGHILNRTHYFKIVEDENSVLNNLVAADEGMYLYLGDPVVFIPGREYDIQYAGATYNCVGIDPAAIGEALDGGCVFGNIGAITGGEDTGEPFVIFSYGRKMADMGGASMAIADMSGSTIATVIIGGPKRVREKIAPEWLPHPEIGLLTYNGTMDSSGNITVPHTYTYEDISARIKNGHILSAMVDVGTVVIGFDFNSMNSDGVDFVHHCNVNSQWVLSINVGGTTSVFTRN